MFDQVEKAAARLKGRAHRTPVMTSRTLDRRVGASVFFKCENFQRIGAFKSCGDRHDTTECPSGILQQDQGPDHIGDCG